MLTTLESAVTKAKNLPTQRLSVAVPEDKEVLLALKEGYDLGICEPILVGDKQKIYRVSENDNVDISSFEIIDITNNFFAAKKSVELVKKGEADIVMKGSLQTKELLKAVLDKDIGLRTSRILSHVAVLDVKKYDKLLFLTDAAMNIAPDLREKSEILQNAVEVCIGLGIKTPKAAVLAAVETVNEKMNATIDAAMLSKMSERGQLKNVIVDGPLALDNAISHEAAKLKGIESPVAGEADILLVPYIEVGNVIYKSLTHLAEAEIAGIIAGATAPIIITSRADSHKSKVNSIAIASIFAANKKK